MEITKIFEKKFQKEPEEIFWSPGRVNIIGEHTDYHDGFVMPMAIDLGITWAISRRGDDQICGYSEKFDEVGKFKISDTSRTEYEWMLYLQGVIEVLKKRNYKFGGVNFAIHSTIPIGSGLSSSSSLATGFTYILNDLYNLGMTRVEIAKVACEAEWWYGTTGGIMDQFCIANGKAGKAVLLDARSLEFELIPIPEDIEIVVFETTIRHKQIDSPFALRREQAQKAIEILQNKYPDKSIIKLRDVTAEMLDSIKDDLLEKYGQNEGEMIYRRTLHPILENGRVLEMKTAFANSDFSLMGHLLNESHESLRKNYEVSCDELNIAVSIAHNFKNGFIGARMIGGGFGGCTINLVKRGTAKKFSEEIEGEFEKSTGIKGNAYICKSSSGVEKIKNLEGKKNE